MAATDGTSGASRVAREMEGGREGPLVGAARRVENVAQKATEFAERVGSSEFVENSRGVIRENPFRTVLIAAGVGALVGYLIGCRHR
jgi:ElaB/YqjD/DUF883 family membrane-anchored ribosome-binding protein